MKIKLYNRDGADLYLENCDVNLWKLSVDDKHKYVLGYIRVGYENDNKTINFIDPSGGPYLSVGQRVNKDYVISSIIEADKQFKIQLTKKMP